MAGQQFNYSVWEDDGWISDEQFHSPTEMTINSNNFQFQHNEYTVNENDPPTHQIYNENYSSKMAFFYEPPNQVKGFTQTSSILGNLIGYSNIAYNSNGNSSEFDEPPLLEELEIYPDQILQKVKVVLDPFRNNVPSDSDLGGPVIFYLTLAFFMFLSAGKFNFGYVYGISVTGCIMIYFLLKAMTESEKITFMAVASVLGYSILPIVLLSAFGVLFSLKNAFGYIMGFISVCWASYAASKIFCGLTDNKTQHLLIMYPCALLYCVFTLLIIF